MTTNNWEPHYRWWVLAKQDIGWLCIRKTRWRWQARAIASHKTRRGWRVKVEDRG